MRPVIFSVLLLIAVGSFTETAGQSAAPQINAVSPTTARVGDQIVITGSGFGSSQGSGNVWLGSTYGVVVSWSDTQVVATVSSGSKSGVAQILQGGVWSNAVDFTVITPNITSVTPATAIAGTQITITGSGFGASQGNGNVWLGSTYGAVVNWSDTQVVATVASGSKSGVAQIVQGGVWSNAIDFSVITPNIVSVAPTTAIAGTQITITGTGFGASQGSGNVWLGSTYGIVVNWSDTRVVATLASGSKSGVAQILQGGVWSNSVNLTVITPNITSVTPTTASAGTQITISGSGFGTTQGNGSVWLGSTYGALVSWTDTQIVATVASGSKNGVAQVLQGGVWSNSVDFTVTTPNITTVSPITTVAGTQVTITGTGFGATQGNGNVWLGSTYGVPVSWSDTQVVATVASGSKSGVAQVLQGGVWSSPVNLTVITPNIGGISPTSGTAGTQITITGTGFGSSQGSGNAWLGSTYGVVVSWSDTRVVATVASGSKSGVAQILQGGVWSNSVTLTVTTLNITSVAPSSATAGTQVTITGSGFGATQGTGSILLGTTSGVVLSWSDTQIIASVAYGSQSGFAQVSQGGATSNAVNFTVPLPTITSVTPAAAPVGAPITIIGSGFGAFHDQSAVSFNRIAATTRSWNDARVVAVVPSGATTGTVSIAVAGVASNAFNFAVTAAPSITSVSPNSGPAGTQVSISGSGFGSAQGTGSVMLGTRPGTVVSWADTQIVATVGTGSVSGSAQVQQNGASSNSVPFTVNTAAVTSVSPTSGSPGTQVTINGSGFGSAEGSGQAWLGTAAAVVTSWSDTQVVAIVATGSSSGSAMILQNGVWSNPVGFTVSSVPHISFITPNTGNPGTVVTIQGTGFGTSQGSGIVSIGTANAAVNTWSDTQVSATVASSAISGVVKIQPNGVWSNALTFTVPSGFSASGPGQVTLNPNVVNMVVGDTQPIMALGTNGKPVAGLTWTSSDTTIATLSTDDPPIITAVAPGNATITAGGASADVTVSASSALPTGTVLWSDPGNGSGVRSFYPAVPSSTGVADVFAVQNDGSVEAITSDGAVAWSTNVPPSNFGGNSYLPDFQGGLTIFGGLSVNRLDGLTGHPYSSYLGTTDEDQTFGLGYPAIHTDGTIFTLDYSCATADCPWNKNDTSTGAWVVGVDPSSGAAKFKIPTANSVAKGTADAFCSSAPGPTPTIAESFPTDPIIAGDGFAYMAYTTNDSNETVKRSATEPWPDSVYHLNDVFQADLNVSNYSAASSDLLALYQAIGHSADPSDPLLVAVQNGDRASIATYDNALQQNYGLFRLCDHFGTSITKLHLMRVGSDGSSSDVVVNQWSESHNTVNTFVPGSFPIITTETQHQTGPKIEFNQFYLITNSDQGVLFSWQVVKQCYAQIQTDPNCPQGGENHLTIGTGGGIVSDNVVPPVVPNQFGPFAPILQLQDGSYIGTVSAGSYMVAFDTSGNVNWLLPGYTPQMATADGGIIATSSDSFLPGTATTFDSTGSATGQLANFPTYSWKGAYQRASVSAVAFPMPTLLTTFAAFSGGNLTGNGTPMIHRSFGLFFCGSAYGAQGYFGPCLQGNGNDINWDYYPLISSSCPSPTCGASALKDFSADHREWIGPIEREALKSFQAAYAKFPIQVKLATQTPVCFGQFCSLDSKPDQDFTAYVLGDYPYPTAGQRFVGTNGSGVYYFYYMENAQIALGHPDVPSTGAGWDSYSPSYPPQDAPNFVALLEATGRAIGNAAAHEMGHHLELITNIQSNGNKGFPFMDCGLGNPGDRNRPVAIKCEENDNFVYSFYIPDGFPQDPANPKSTGGMFFYGVSGTGQPGAPFQPAIHWGPSNTLWLQNYSAPNSGKQP